LLLDGRVLRAPSGLQPVGALGDAAARRGGLHPAAVLPVLSAAGLSRALRELGRARLGARGHARGRACAAADPRQRRQAVRRRDRRARGAGRPPARSRAGAGELMAVATEHRIGRDEVIWAFGPDLEPVLEVDPGAVVTLETNDCFTGQIRTEDDLVTEIDFERVNSATGPIAVRGAEPGDSLVVELLEVRPGERGFATLIPGMGQLIEQVRSPLTQGLRGEGDTIPMTDRIA